LGLFAWPSAKWLGLRQAPYAGHFLPTEIKYFIKQFMRNFKELWLHERDRWSDEI